MRSFSSTCLALVALSVATSSGVAQQPRILLETGARVRLSNPTLQSNQRIVHILSVASDTAVFQSERNLVTQRLALSDISAVEVSVGQRRRTGRGALIGLVAGTAIGAIAGYAGYKKPELEPCPFGLDPSGLSCAVDVGAGGEAVASGVGGGLAGLLIGTTIGWLSKTEKWQRVPFSARTAIVPSRSGVVVSVSRAF